MARVTRRDLEVLRSIARLKAVSTKSLHGVFFSHLRVAQRRVSALRELGLIARVDGLVPTRQGACAPGYWRLTTLGAETVAESFPAETGDVVERTVRARRLSLRHVEHQDALVRLYLSLIADGDLEITREKANSLAVLGDHDVSLPYEWLSKRRLVKPDMTLWATGGKARFFIEMDRSTHTHRSILRTAKAYARCVTQGGVRSVFEDERPVGSWLIFVTKTRARRDNLERKLHGHQEAGFPVGVFEFGEAIPWLQKGLFGEGECAMEVSRADERTVQPEVEAGEMLRRLYSDYHADLKKHGATAPASLCAAYEFLRRNAPDTFTTKEGGHV